MELLMQWPIKTLRTLHQHPEEVGHREVVVEGHEDSATHVA